MNKFSFMIHPLDVHDFARKFPIAEKIPDRLLENLFKFSPPVKTSHISGIKSKYAEAEGYFVACPLTTRQMLKLPEKYVLQKIISAGRMAEKLGAQILGLGAMTSVVGDAGITVAKNLHIPVTTGNSYTVFTALEGTRKAAEIMGIDLANAEILIVGATGAIGAICARIMAKEARYITLAARNKQRLENLARQILVESGLAVGITTNIQQALCKADIVITVTSSAETVIEPGYLKSGAVVCDVARPRDVSKRVAEKRDDVLVIEGGMVEVPGDVCFNFNFGYPPKLALACMAETMVLALEGKFESYTLGRNLTVEQVEEIGRLAKKHGFKLAGFRSFERPVDVSQIEKIRERALAKKIAL
ncbi:shikimate dehydrogenase [Bacillota bacterium LX-D]|nr:shikimate dehydrogenase [Bacillota bacterium LX-D]